MNQQPLVSVIIPTYNRKELVKRAIDSVLNQIYKDIEIIIIDGSPNDGTGKVIRPYLADSRIHYIHQPEIHTGSVKDRGNIAKARDKGIRISSGKYIACLDDDDFWLGLFYQYLWVTVNEEGPKFALIKLDNILSVDQFPVEDTIIGAKLLEQQIHIDPLIYKEDNLL